MPIGVSYYTDYNTLAVFAPELNGLWSYASIPGVTQSDGTINHTTTSKTTGTVMMNNSDEKEASWEFIKWWLGEEAQLGYARNMEAVLGAAARYPTANLKAFEQLPWATKDYIILNEARENAKGMPVVPGDYIVGRYVDNAFRSVINDNVNPYDSLYNYHIKINKELERKRKEFGL
jgi:ABC-type glycerol-3-phosphate transport system substrate-binding protein